MANRPSLDELLGDSPTTQSSSGRPPLGDILEGKISPQTEEPKKQSSVVGDIFSGITTPLISKDSVLKSNIGQFMADANPMSQAGGVILPPPFSQMIPPAINRGLKSEMISDQTSPLAILSNITLLKSLQAGKVVPNLVKFGGKKTAQQIAESADKGFDSIGKLMSNKYETLFDRIKGGAISNSKIFESMRSVVDAYPEAAGVPKLQKIMNRLSDVDTISAKELHELKQVVRKSIPRGVWNGTQEADAIQNAMRDIYFTITDGLEQIGGKEYSGLSQEYKKVKDAEKLAKKMFYKNGVPSNEALNKGMDIPTKRAIKSLDEMLPESEKFASDFNAWKRGQAIKKIAGRVGIGAAIGAGEYGILKSLK